TTGTPVEMTNRTIELEVAAPPALPTATLVAAAAPAPTRTSGFWSVPALVALLAAVAARRR
ncbi:MAG TPA: hypothetical protein PLG95_05110, partial [Methanoculleus sp.]|nr:hypothetical protein [Methanoculleus sp.]